MPGKRRSLAALTLLVGVVAAASALLGAHEWPLYFAPLILIAGLLLNGRFVGEERIVARRSVVGVPRLRAPRRLARPVAQAMASLLLARRTHLERGPPAGFALPLVV